MTPALHHIPRMYSSNAEHVQEYKNWAGIKGTPVQASTVREIRKH